MIKESEPIKSMTKEARKRRNRSAKKKDLSNYVVIYLKREADYIHWLAQSHGVSLETVCLSEDWWFYRNRKDYRDNTASALDHFRKMGYTRFYGERNIEDFADVRTRIDKTQYVVNRFSSKLWGRDNHASFFLIHNDNGDGFVPVLVLFDPDHRDLDFV